MDEISIIDVPTQKVIGIRRKGKYALIAELLPKLYEYSVEKGVQITGPPMFICHEQCPDDVKKADEEGTADIEIVFPIGAEIDCDEDYTCYELAGGPMAKIIHKGPYEACQPTYEKLFTWLEKNAKTITGPMREVYLNDPREVTPEEIITEIYAPIA
jgi:effector-binding domain-containing protein